MKTSISDEDARKMLHFKAQAQTLQSDLDNLTHQTALLLDDHEYVNAEDWLESDGQTLASWLSSRGIERGF